MNRELFDDLLGALTRPDPARGSGLDQLATRCMELAGASGASLVLMTDGQLPTGIGATAAWVAALDEQQFTVGQGPSLDAYTDGRPVLLDDTTATTRWPESSAVLAEQGIGGIAAFPLQLGAIKLGVMTLYRNGAGHLDHDELAVALGIADAATDVLLAIQHQDASSDALAWPLAAAADHRAAIHQATGMVAAQLGCAVDEALLRLRAHAYAEDLLIIDIARQVVTRQLRFAP